MLCKCYEALHELGAPTVALGTIVQIDDQGRDVRKARLDALPPVDQPIHQTIAGHFGRHPVEKELIGGGQDNAHRRHRRRWLKIVVGGPGGHATLATTRKGTDLDRRFGVD